MARGRTVDMSLDRTEAKVTFLIIEGKPYSLRTVQTEPHPLRIFAPEQITAMIPLKPGDVFSRDRIDASIREIQDAYGLMGYLGV